MSSVLLALVIGAVFAGWGYSKLARSTGNASPRSNMLVAGLGGFLVFLLVLSVFKWVLHF